jgi:hypothetical protein
MFLFSGNDTKKELHLAPVYVSESEGGGKN